MRFLMKVNMPVEAGNKAARDGTLSEKIQSILEMMKPEAVYFTEDNGERTAYIFFNMDDPSQIPEFAEPWFLALNAKLTYRPAMIPEDLMKAGPAIEAAVKKFG